MATQQEKIQQMYDELYKSKYDQLVKDKENKLNGLNTQSTQINNNYTNTKSELDRQRQDITDRYNKKYSELDDNLAEGKQKYYGDRNNAAYNHAKNTQATRDYMARQNLLQSGESVDALLRNNTDFSNNLGNIYSAEQKFNKGIADTRNQFQSEQNSYYGQLDNSLNKALAEKDRLLASLESERASINSGFDGSVSALQSEIKSQAMKDIMAYEEQLRQEAWQKQMEEERRKWEAEQSRIEWERQVEEQKRQEQWQLANRSYSGGGGVYSSGGYSESGITAEEVKAAMSSLNNDFNAYIKAGDTRNARDVLFQASRAYQNGLITGQDYNNMQRKLTALEDEISKAEVEAKKKNGQKLTYGYRNGVAGYY